MSIYSAEKGSRTTLHLDLIPSRLRNTHIPMTLPPAPIPRAHPSATPPTDLSPSPPIAPPHPLVQRAHLNLGPVAQHHHHVSPGADAARDGAHLLHLLVGGIQLLVWGEGEGERGGGVEGGCRVWVWGRAGLVRVWRGLQGGIGGCFKGRAMARERESGMDADAPLQPNPPARAPHTSSPRTHALPTHSSRARWS